MGLSAVEYLWESWEKKMSCEATASMTVLRSLAKVGEVGHLEESRPRPDNDDYLDDTCEVHFSPEIHPSVCNSASDG